MDDGSLWAGFGYVASVVDSRGALQVEVAHDGEKYLWCSRAMSKMVVQCYGSASLLALKI